MAYAQPSQGIQERLKPDSMKRAGKTRSDRARIRKTMKDAMLQLLAAPITDPKLEQKVADQLGVSVKEVNNQTVIMASMYKQAKNGDVRAAQFLRDTIGEAPQSQVVVEKLVATPLAPIKED